MLFDGADEGVDILERKVDAGKAHPCHAIDGLERGHHAFADIAGVNFWNERFGEVAFYPCDDGALLLTRDGSFLACAL